MPPHVHTQTLRVAMSEVDVAQIHFTAVYRWMDRGFSEWLAEVGHPFTRILEEGPGVPIVDSRCRFLGRIMLDDLIDAPHRDRGNRPHLVPGAARPSRGARRSSRAGSSCTSV